MNANYQMNTKFAISKALEAVRSWEKALEANKAAQNVEGIAFCEASLAKCQESLAATRESVKQWWMWN